jgi:hypothetical protein
VNKTQSCRRVGVSICTFIPVKQVNLGFTWRQILYDIWIAGGHHHAAKARVAPNKARNRGRCRRCHLSAYVSIRQHTSAYVSIRQHTSAYVSMRQPHISMPMPSCLAVLSLLPLVVENAKKLTRTFRFVTHEKLSIYSIYSVYFL